MWPLLAIMGFHAMNFNETDERAFYTEEQRLYYHLMSGYDRNVRPVHHHKSIITVKVGLTLTTIFDLSWEDEMLQWNPAEFGGIENIRVPCDNIWLPDIVLYNSADDMTRGYMRARAMLNYKGTVFWPPPVKLRATCTIDVSYFPFDSQLCRFKYGSWTYDGFQVDLTNASTNIDLSNYVANGEFDLIDVYQKRSVAKYSCCPEPYPDVTFYIRIRRKTLYYMYNIIFPCMMMSALTLLVFCLPPKSGEKIALGITVLLAFSVFVLAIAEKMPETSDSMPLIGIYLTSVMSMTCVSVVMTVMVLNFHHRNDGQPLPKLLRWLLFELVGPLLCYRPMNELEDAGISQSASSRHHLSSADLNLGADSVLFGEKYLDSQTVHVEQMYLGEHTAGTCSVCPFGQPVDVSHHQQRQSRSRHRHKAKVVGNQLEIERRYLSPGSTLFRARIREILRLLTSKKRKEKRDSQSSRDWQRAAQILDHLLFWIFLLATAVITLVLLIVVPFVEHYNMPERHA